MSEIHVRFEALATGEQSIRTAYRALATTLEGLEHELAPMIASWSGDAQQAYLASKREWDDAARSLAEVLATIGDAVGQAHENYVAAERSAQGCWM